eukprot:gnl/Hemi2/11029_TR3783_c0_g10_i1.p2 gnl/Hemi2/11029_TR3783_c0_g10~~gnl/Hemi2/11029_TR3783_c0_g10_i1.p2  ORF type:complete len:374 (-),score=147.32 gnl/Hemi2/11029_TR3783_c0_g10_i1:57-1178(-)
MRTTLLLLLGCLALATAQMILNPSAYDVAKQDISLDSTPKCQACRHIIASLRNHFVGATSLSPTSIIYEADPCVMAPPGVQNWCSDVYKKLLQCPVFVEKIFDRSFTAVKVCESCGYDQFPLPPVRFCDNSLYLAYDTPNNDKCSDCMDLVRRIQVQGNPCERLTGESCTELQNALSRCGSYNKYIHQPFVEARRICEECSADLPDNTNPPGMMPTMFCDRPVASPLTDNSACSVCVNVVHNIRSFPMENPCTSMNDEHCSYTQDRLTQCTVFNRMIEQHQYSALSICEECTDNRNPLAPIKFCSGEGRSGSATGWFDARNPQRPTQNFPGTFNNVASPMLKAEPPASFTSPWWLKQAAVGAAPAQAAGEAAK